MMRATPNYQLHRVDVEYLGRDANDKPAMVTESMTPHYARVLAYELLAAAEAMSSDDE